MKGHSRVVGMFCILISIAGVQAYTHVNNFPVVL